MQTVKATMIAIAAIAATSTLFLPGCSTFFDERDSNNDGVVTRVEAVGWYQNTIDKTRILTADFQEGVDMVTIQIMAMGDYRDTLDPAGEDWMDIQSGINILARERDRLQNLVNQGNAKIDNVQEILRNLPDSATVSDLDGQVFGEAVRTMTPYLPPPWNFVATGLATLIPGLALKLRQVINERDTIIMSVDEGKRKHPEFASGIDSASATIRSVQGWKLARKVDGIRAVVKTKTTTPDA